MNIEDVMALEKWREYWSGDQTVAFLFRLIDKQAMEIVKLEASDLGVRRELTVAQEQIARLQASLKNLIGWSLGMTCSDCDPLWYGQEGYHEVDCAHADEIDKACIIVGYPIQARHNGSGKPIVSNPEK